jgi:hypothetical protein
MATLEYLLTGLPCADCFGKAFTNESVAAAITAYTALEALLKDRRHVSKSIAADLTSSMHAAWASEIKRRGLPDTSVPLSSTSKKRHAGEPKLNSESNNDLNIKRRRP